MLLHTDFSLNTELTSRVPEEVYGDYVSRVSPSGSKNEGATSTARTDTAFFPMSEVCEGINSFTKKSKFCYFTISQI